MNMKLLLPALLAIGVVSGFGQDHIGRARAALASRDTAVAVEAFTDAARAGQKSSEANYHLGAIALSRGNIQEAIGFLQTSIRQDDENVNALKTLARAHLRNSDPKSALEQMRRATRVAPRDCDVSLMYGRALLEADSVDTALIFLTRARECAPNDPWVYIGLGDAYQKQGVTPLAITNYQKAVEIDPKNIETRYVLARAFERNRQYNEAVKVYEEVVESDSLYADAYFQMGSIFYRAKLYPRAVAPLRRYKGLRPGEFEPALMLAKSLLEVRNYPDAAEAAKAALDIDSSSSDPWRIYFFALVEVKDFARAEGALASLQRRGQLDAQDFLKLGDLYFGLKRREDALKWYNQAVASDSTNCEPYFNLGFLYMQSQQYADAAANFEKRIACDPNSISSYVNAAASYLQTKNLGRARELLVKSIEIKPDFFNGRLWLARYYVQADSFDMARQQYEEVLRLIGDQTDKYKREAGEAHSLLASLFVNRKEYGKALESFRKAAALNYENSGMHLSWGQALLQTLDPTGSAEENKRINEDAVRHFRKCVELDPNNSQGHLWLAEGLVRSRVAGDDENNRRVKEEACSEYRKVLKLDPKSEDARKGLERIGC